jgi:hypothetical protein
MYAWPQALCPLFLAVLFAWLWWRSRLREREIRALAASLSLHYLGEALPSSFSLAGAPFDSITSVWNVVDGELRGVRVIAFDCRFGEGKASWRRTVIAANTDLGNVAASMFDPYLRIEQNRDWTVIWWSKDLSLIPPGLMPAAELRTYLESI